MNALGTFVLTSVLAGNAAAGAPLRETAERLGAAARRAGIVRLAVLPMESREGAVGTAGARLADRLTEELLRVRRVRVVERSRLSDVMSERRLGAAGAVDGAVEAPLEAADAVVAGVYEVRGETARASVRLVSARTGEILAAAEESVPWDGPAPERAAAPSRSWTIVVPPPALDVPVPDLGDEALEFKDAPNDDACAGARERVDRIVEGIVDLKARYWASELRKGFSPYSVTRNPGSEIADPVLKDRFYETMKEWYRRPFVPDLSPAELARMRREDARAGELVSRCGI